MVRRVLLAFVCALALTGGGSSPADAQSGLTPRERQELERRVRQAFQARVRQELRLTAGEMGSLREVISWSEGERQRIAAETRSLNGRVADFLRDGGTADDARTILTERASLQRRGTQLFLDEQERLLEVISPSQVVRFYRLRDEFNARILRARQTGRPGGLREGGERPAIEPFPEASP